MTEAELQAAVTSGTKAKPGLCVLLGVRWYHTHDSRRSPSGWPDLVLCGTSGLIFRELKSETGTVTPEQRGWGSWLTRVGCDWAVWRPRDLRSGVIARQLEAIR